MNTTGKPDTPLLDVSDLTVQFRVPGRGSVLYRKSKDVKAVNGVSFSLARGETLGLVGESGCGKSTTGRATLQLLRPTGGRVIFDGEPIHEFWEKRAQTWVWDKRLVDLRCRMQMIFQDPFASLNPRMTVGQIIAEPIIVHGLESKLGSNSRVIKLLNRVGLDEQYYSRYPHELSGGQRQRIGIARALALEPKLIIADEAVSALDVSIQAQVVNLMMELQEELGLTYLFISHDMAVIERVSHRIGVMYLGEIVEIGLRSQIFENPQHPYTKKLMAAVPIADPTKRKKKLNLMNDEIPSLLKPIGYEPEYVQMIKLGEDHYVKPFDGMKLQN